MSICRNSLEYSQALKRKWAETNTKVSSKLSSVVLCKKRNSHSIWHHGLQTTFYSSAVGINISRNKCIFLGPYSITLSEKKLLANRRRLSCKVLSFYYSVLLRRLLHNDSSVSTSRASVQCKPLVPHLNTLCIYLSVYTFVHFLHIPCSMFYFHPLCYFSTVPKCRKLIL